MEIGNKTISQLSEELRQIPFLEDLESEQLLEKVPFFEEMDKRLILKVADQGLLLQFIKDEIICRQGDYEETFYIVLSGKVEVTTHTQNQRSIHLAYLETGTFLERWALFLVSRAQPQLWPPKKPWSCKSQNQFFWRCFAGPLISGPGSTRNI